MPELVLPLWKRTDFKSGYGDAGTHFQLSELIPARGRVHSQVPGALKIRPFVQLIFFMLSFASVP